MRYPLVALTLAALATHAFAEDEYSAKSLFFSASDSVVAVGTGPKAGSDSTTQVATSTDPAAQAAPNLTPTVTKVSQKKKRSTQLGASYFIRLKDADGSTHDVLTRRIFKSGEKFQLGVKVNRPSYVYILNEAPDGTITQIYPQPSQDNFVDAMGIVFFPAKGAFQFDDKPGMEKLMVYLSPERAHGDVTRRLRAVAPDLVANPVQKTADAGSCPATAATVAAAPAAASDSPAMQLASASTDYAAKGISFAADQPGGCAVQTAQADTDGYAAKGIVFSDDQSPAGGGQVASYVVKHTTKADPTLFLKINLAHE
ncbi:DUF4384 domain-containing protein [Paraburkholderia diazotrophica]|uniref:DUF4384 domain-containing protein n=1 Tax=Paraburkholderia diazotrophica TaxID=667676 RepID=UPI003179B061